MSNPTTIKYLKDYQHPTYLVTTTDLEFNIQANNVIATVKSSYYKNPLQAQQNSLILNGSTKLVSLKLNQQEFNSYTLINDELTLTNLPESFELTIVTEIDAFNNQSCMGLYASQGSLFTQCEPEGFRKITYYQDRPDVMAIFTTSIIADNTNYPVMLSNGNKLSEETLSDGRTKVIWHDPFKKPSYLFALVAGKFAVLEDSFTTNSGRKIQLEVYSDAESISQCSHCLASLKRAMAWDEQRFNLEYDLDRYMIVASGDFNMGAMENKGLNIFNTKYVLADSKTATDTDFINVEAVVGHEYFHNWTGNRVTCRNWFQLSLKEGLTVFRDQEFTSDLHSRAVKRIQSVKNLRQGQFPEDASALAHPIRPASYLEMNNFYTMTVYEKGSEVVRMYQTILGQAGFKKGMELYFARHDGQAVTCNEFCSAMADANKINLDQFLLWYSQAGTPTLKISDSYNAATQEYQLNIEQHTPATPDMTNKAAMLIPLELGLIAADGKELEFDLIEGEFVKPETNYVLLINQTQNIFKFKVNQQPTPSLLRNFSAPVIVDYPYTQTQLLNLAANDSNSFNRWEAIQTVYKQVIARLYASADEQAEYVPNELIAAISVTLRDENLDPSMRSLIATTPSFAELALQFKPVNVVKLTQAINYLRQRLSDALEDDFLALYQHHQTKHYDFNDAGKRALKNTALSYLLLSSNQTNYLGLVQEQYSAADNMTDKIAALNAINDLNDQLRTQLLAEFNQRYAEYPLVMDKWFMLQSQSQLPETLINVKSLIAHPQFDAHNPNKLYALIRAFTANNLLFNSSEGYRFIADEVLRIDKFNSGVASRVAQGFSIVNSLNSDYHKLARPELQRILAETSLSKDVYEIISKTINQLD